MKSPQTVIVFSFSVAKNSVNLSKNYYKILEVDIKSDEKVIKKSYLKLVKTLHPDVNPHGKDKFTEVQQAYEVLSDQELKKYYDQNNYCNKNGDSSEMKKETHSAQSKTQQAKTGHQYYSHRTYASENPHDYFYNPNTQKASHSQKNNNNQQKYDEQWEQEENRNKKSGFNRQQKRARSQSSWEEFQRQKQYQQQKKYQQQTPEQREMRDKLKAMRGFTSPYNVLWARHHMRYNDLLHEPGQMEKKREQQLRKMMPEKMRKFYDKIMKKIEKMAED